MLLDQPCGSRVLEGLWRRKTLDGGLRILMCPVHSQQGTSQWSMCKSEETVCCETTRKPECLLMSMLQTANPGPGGAGVDKGYRRSARRNDRGQGT